MALKEVKSLPASKPKRTISLRWLMILGFGGLVGLSVGLVLFISVSANFANTFSLLGSRATVLIDGMERSIAAETDQAERVVRALARSYRSHSFEVGDAASQRALLSSLLTAIPVVEGLLVFNINGNRSGIVRLRDGSFRDIQYGPGSQADQDAFAASSKEPVLQPTWAEPVFINGVLFHNVVMPLIRDDKIDGVAVAAIGRHAFNRVVSQLGKSAQTTAFVITRDMKVVAHSQLPGAFRGKRNIPLEKFPDNALRDFSNANEIKFAESGASENTKFFEADSRSGDGGHIFITREFDSIGPEPYLLGAYFTKADMGTEVTRALKSAFAGLVAMIIAILAAVFLGRSLSKPLHKIAKVADQFSNLELENYQPLPKSRIREINEQAEAMNSMHHALTEFSRYIPHTLVKKLMHSGSQATRSVEREVTVMFSDIVGFTAMSEKLNAVETAELLNNHFNLMGQYISETNGTIDKFIGDGIMAYWGAPDADNDQASNALNSAQKIIVAQKSYNRKRIAEGLEAVRLRIGIHTGRAVVGNIGSEQRQNYTMVGDVVNVAQRLEQLGKQMGGNPETLVLISESTRQKVEYYDNLCAIGSHHLRGRQKPVKVYAIECEDVDINVSDIPQSHSIAG